MIKLSKKHKKKYIKAMNEYINQRERKREREFIIL